MDVERVGCAGDGPIVLEEAFQGVYGIGELQWGVAVKNLLTYSRFAVSGIKSAKSSMLISS